MVLVKIGTVLFLLMAFNSCSLNKLKLESILDKQIGKEQLVERTRLALDSVLGRRDSILKRSTLNLINDRLEIKYMDVVIEGRNARVKVLATVPKMDEIESLLLLASYLPREKMLGMTIQDVLAEVSKSSRRPAAQEDINSETYLFSVDFIKGKEWAPNSEQLKKAYSRKNLIVSK